MGGAERRREVLAAGADGVTESRGQRYFHRLRRRAERISRSHRSRIPADRGATLHRASGAGFAKLCALEITQGRGCGFAFDLSCRHGGRSGTASGGAGSEVESLSQREPSMAAELGAHHALFQLPHRYSHGHLYHQQRGIAEPVAAQDHQNPRRLPQRRSCTEVAVLGLAPSGEEVDHADSSLARGAEPLHDSVAGAHARPGKDGIMNHRLLHRWAREEALPLPSRTHPQTQKQTSAVYTEELTDLSAAE